MHLVPDSSPRPFPVIQLLGNWRVAAFGVPAAASGRADEQLTRAAEDVDRLAIGAPDDITHPRRVRRARQAGDGIRRRLVVLVLVKDPGSVLGRSRVNF